MESAFFRVVRSNDVKTIQQFLRNNVPDLNELDTRLASRQTPQQVRDLLQQYKYLLTNSLTDFMNDDYRNKGANNLMVIAARGYLPILKRSQVSSGLSSGLVNRQSNDGKTALVYALYNPDNKDIVAYLIQNGANIDAISQQLINVHASNANDISLRNYYKSLSSLTMDQINKDARWEIMLNAEPQDLYNLCTSNKLFSQICATPAFRNQYITKNEDKLRQYILSKDPVKADKLCRTELYEDICSNPTFRTNYINKWLSEFSDDGVTSKYNPTRSIMWYVTILPVTSDGEVHVEFFDDTISNDSIPLSEDQLNSIIFPNTIVGQVINAYFSIVPNTLFGVTLRSLLEQLYVRAYIDLNSMADYPEIITTIPEQWPDDMTGDKSLYEGFTLHHNPSTGSPYYSFSFN